MGTAPDGLQMGGQVRGAFHVTVKYGSGHSSGRKLHLPDGEESSRRPSASRRKPVSPIRRAKGSPSPSTRRSKTLDSLSHRLSPVTSGPPPRMNASGTSLLICPASHMLLSTFHMYSVNRPSRASDPPRKRESRCRTIDRRHGMSLRISWQFSRGGYLSGSQGNVPGRFEGAARMLGKLDQEDF